MYFLDIEQVLQALTPAVYESLKRAVEIGKWPDGAKLTVEQRALCLQAVIAYDTSNKPADERVGFIPSKKHQHCGSSVGELAEDGSAPLEDKAIKWTH